MSYVKVPASEIQPIAFRILQHILDKREAMHEAYHLERYKNYFRWRRWFPFGKILTFEEHKSGFNEEYLTITESFRYATIDCMYGAQEESLRNILGLCQLNVNGEIRINSDDASYLGYPHKTVLPLTTQEQEVRVAEQELGQLLVH